MANGVENRDVSYFKNNKH